MSSIFWFLVGLSIGWYADRLPGWALTTVQVTMGYITSVWTTISRIINKDDK